MLKVRENGVAQYLGEEEVEEVALNQSLCFFFHLPIIVLQRLLQVLRKHQYLRQQPACQVSQIWHLANKQSGKPLKLSSCKLCG